MSLLTIIPAFLVAIGVLVTVHEFGHFWVARKLGVKVLRFSVGFGKPLWRHVSKDEDKIEYVVAALPLGGYVKMLDERELEEDQRIPAHELPRAFNRQVLWKRAAIVAAGPIANFLLAIIIYAAVFMIGQEARVPYVNAAPESPAMTAGFQPGDKITAINHVTTASWEDVRMLIVEEYLKSPQLLFSVETQDGMTTQRSLNLGGVSLFKDENDAMEKVGLEPWMPDHDVLVHKVLPATPAALANLQAGDRIMAVDGNKVTNMRDLILYIREHADTPIVMEVGRNGSVVDVTVTPTVDVAAGMEHATIGAHLGAPDSMREQLFFVQSYGPLDAVAKGVEKTWQMSMVTLKLMGRMLTGEVALKNISGPVTIAQFAGVTASIGLVSYLGFLAIVSISLGVLNLLPIPMLDGGHLLYYLIELVKGSPVSEQVEAIGFRVGMAIIACLMVLALYNDFMRLIS